MGSKKKTKQQIERERNLFVKFNNIEDNFELIESMMELANFRNIGIKADSEGYQGIAVRFSFGTMGFRACLREDEVQLALFKISGKSSIRDARIRNYCGVEAWYHMIEDIINNIDRYRE